MSMSQVVFGVMMVIKGMSYALNNPTKEILYQVRTSILGRIIYMRNCLCDR